MAANDDFKKGLLKGIETSPNFIAVFLGFGMASQAVGIDPIAAFFMTMILFAGPAQFAIVDAVSTGSGVIGLISAGILANLRFFVMSMSLVTIFEGVSRLRMAVSAHFIAATPFLLTFFHARREDFDRGGEGAFRFFQGVGIALIISAIIGTAIGVFIGADLPEVIAFGVSLFMPIYFSLLIASDIKGKFETISVVIGFLLTPVINHFLPGFGLIIGGVTAGAAAVAWERP